jgi:hypothetical protein
MAVTVLYTVVRSEDFKSIKIQDAGTQWTTSGEMDKSAVTAISLSLFGTDKTDALKIVGFTSEEKTSFLAGDPVTFLFSDPRLWETMYQPDNFVTTQMEVLGGETVSTQVCFDSYFYIQKIVMDHVTSVQVPINEFYEANRAITGDLAAITTLEYLSSTINASRENKWRKLYNFLAWIYNV